MHVAFLIASLIWGHGVAARSGSPLVNKRSSVASRFENDQPQYANSNRHRISRRQNTNTSAFIVDGTKIPDVNFDVGESYAGFLSVSQDLNETNKLYFWYFPSTSEDAEEEIVIWLNGGPGCSSLEGLLQENGPFSWKPGTYGPVENRWSWHHLTNMVWVDQPIGTGFSQGKTRDKSEEDMAQHFMGWLRNFIDTFGLHGRKIYLTGESYAAGMYIPYIADAMHSANDTVYSNLIGTLGYSPTLTWVAVFNLIPSVPFIDHWANVFNLNASFVASMHNASDTCGHTSWMNEHLSYPPPQGPFGNPPDGLKFRPGCDTWSAIFDAAILANPCFNVYHIIDQCPILYDPLGFPTSFSYTPPGATVYFNRSDVQAAINAPSQSWSMYVDDVLNTDTSEWSGFADAGQTAVFPRVIEQSQRTILVGGALDFDVIANGTLLAIQNMTWNGAQGFQTRPSDPFIVPYDGVPFQQAFCTVDDLDSPCGEADFAAEGVMGVTHTERGLTWVEMASSGHMVPQYQPAAAWRHLQFLLGRIDAL